MYFVLFVFLYLICMYLYMYVFECFSVFYVLICFCFSVCSYARTNCNTMHLTVVINKVTNYLLIVFYWILINPVCECTQYSKV